jgi:hypothetical protein
MAHWNESPQEAARRVKAWAHGFGDWWSTYLWNHAIHLTVDGRWSPGRLFQRFEREFIRFATKTVQGSIPYAYAIEGGALGDQAHLHGLIYGTDRLEGQRLEQAWRYGWAKVVVYDPSLGAAHYISKEIGSRVLDSAYQPTCRLSVTLRRRWLAWAFRRRIALGVLRPSLLMGGSGSGWHGRRSRAQRVEDLRPLSIASFSGAGVLGHPHTATPISFSILNDTFRAH